VDDHARVVRGLSLALREQKFVQAARALGVRPPTPTWGRMLAEGRDYLTVAGWISIFPGVAIMITVLGINFLGDGLRNLLDPRLRRQT